jgi:thiamine kinase-like enzyme
LRRGPAVNKWKQLATDFIGRLHVATKTPVSLDETTWNAAVMPLLYAGLASTEQYTGVSAAQITDFLMREILGRSWPLVVNHGDYSPGNLLFDRKGLRLLGVIDWERAILRSLPLLDLLHILLSARAQATQARLSDLFSRVLLGGLDYEDRQFVDSYLQQMDLHVTSSQMRAFLLLDWLLRVSMWVTPRESPWYGKVFWLQRDIEPSGRWLKQLFTQRNPASRC